MVVLFGGHLHMGGMGTTGRKLESAKKERRTVIDHRRRDGRRDCAIKMSLKNLNLVFPESPLKGGSHRGSPLWIYFYGVQAPKPTSNLASAALLFGSSELTMP